jgi:methyltransferase
MTTDDRAAKVERMTGRITRYYEGCNNADAKKIMDEFIPEAVHYFPPGMYGGAYRGAAAIAERWQAAVANFGSYWHIDTLTVNPDDNCAVLEWTHFKAKQGTMLRGIEWVDFDPATGLIIEIRAYYASPQSPGLKVLELEGFDYAGRGYPSAPPPGTR